MHAMLEEQLTWPFFDERHRTFAEELERWASEHVADLDRDDLDVACRTTVGALGRAGWLRHCVAAPFGVRDPLDTRSLCIARETLAYHDSLADFAFAMQGLGSAPISLAGSEDVRSRYLPRVVDGSAIAAFALSETEAGSDAAALETTATRTDDGWQLDGDKTWISNGGIAAFYVVFARTGEAPGGRGITAFVVDADADGCDVARRIDTISPHPLATLRLRACHVADTQRLGPCGSGFKLAMQTLDIFRASVAAAALGFARRAMHAALERVASRRMFGRKLVDFQLTQAAIAEMATGLDTSALLTYRAAWTRDVRGRSTTREAAMAKLVATETAQRTIDRAVQLHGALGVTKGTIVERLYRDVRGLRIYEGASEVQELIVARETLRT